MTNGEYAALLALIAPQVGGKADPCVAKDDETLYRQAVRHEVGNLLYLARMEDPSFDPRVRAALERRLYASVSQQVKQESEAAALFAALRAENIPFLPMKGIVLRPLYPKPEMRTSCDVDVLYDERRRGDVAAVMERLGFALVGVDANNEEYQKGVVTVETHRHLCIQLPRIDAYYTDVFARLLPVAGSEYRMRDEDFYIYQTVHAMKHFVSGGTGLRTVLDVYVYRHQKPDLDRAYLETELTKIGLWPFHQTLEALAEGWFGGAPLTPDLDDVGDYILGSGVYGQTENRVANQTRARGGRFAYLMGRAFPPYRIMKEKYPSLRRFPPALPFYWIGRLFRGIFSRKGDAAREIGAMRRTDPETAQGLQNVMRKAGLADE